MWINKEKEKKAKDNAQFNSRVVTLIKKNSI